MSESGEIQSMSSRKSTHYRVVIIVVISRRRRKCVSPCQVRVAYLSKLFSLTLRNIASKVAHQKKLQIGVLVMISFFGDDDGGVDVGSWDLLGIRRCVLEYYCKSVSS